MKLCARCQNWKPDANFEFSDVTKVTPGNPTSHTRCLHCRTIRTEVREHSTPPRALAKIAPTLHDTLLVSVARAEHAAFIARGAHAIPRPYVHDISGAVMSRRSRVARVGWDLTGPMVSA